MEVAQLITDVRICSFWYSRLPLRSSSFYYVQMDVLITEQGEAIDSIGKNAKDTEKDLEQGYVVKPRSIDIH